MNDGADAGRRVSEGDAASDGARRRIDCDESTRPWCNYVSRWCNCDRLACSIRALTGSAPQRAVQLAAAAVSIAVLLVQAAAGPMLVESPVLPSARIAPPTKARPAPTPALTVTDCAAGTCLPGGALMRMANVPVPLAASGV